MCIKYLRKRCTRLFSHSHSLAFLFSLINPKLLITATMAKYHDHRSNLGERKWREVCLLADMAKMFEEDEQKHNLLESKETSSDYYKGISEEEKSDTGSSEKAVAMVAEHVLGDKEAKEQKSNCESSKKAVAMVAEDEQHGLLGGEGARSECDKAISEEQKSNGGSSKKAVAMVAEDEQYGLLGDKGAEEQESDGGSSKKAKVTAAPLPLSRVVTAETPEWVLSVVRDMNGDAETTTLIFKKTLSATDVNRNQSRLLIPFKKLLKNDFLTPEESLTVKSDGLKTYLFNQRSESWELRLKIWPMKKKSEHGTFNYALNKGWNNVVESNNLKEKDKISLWSFRCGGVLKLVLGTE